MEIKEKVLSLIDIEGESPNTRIFVRHSDMNEDVLNGDFKGGYARLNAPGASRLTLKLKQENKSPSELLADAIINSSEALLFIGIDPDSIATV